MASDFPRTYEEWRHCITVDCGIELTEAFIDARLRALRDPGDPSTAQFVELYGEDYRDQVVAWFGLARSRSGAGQTS